MLLEERRTEQILAGAIEVNKVLGPGLLESAYEGCLCFELSERGIAFKRQVDLPVAYKSVRLSCGYRIDVLVEEAIVVEVKAVEHIVPVHHAQLLTYLRLSGKRVGLILNFNVATLKHGIIRKVL